MMKAFYTSDGPEVTLDNLAKKMRSISCDMKDMKKDLIEAIEKTDSFIGDAAAVYLQGSIEMIDCLLAERAHLLRQGTKSAECDADYCVDKIKSILPGDRILSTEQMQYIINYVKTYHPEKTLREFLQYVGFKFTGSDHEKAFIMVNMGGPKSMQMSSGCACSYYYKGVDLKDKSYKESENLYLYVSIGWTTVSRNEAQYPMYYMICS